MSVPAWSASRASASARGAGQHLPDQADFGVLLRPYGQGLVEVLFHLATSAEPAGGVGQRAHRHQRHVAQRGLLEGEGDGGLSGREPSAPSTTGPGGRLAGRHAPRTTTTGPAACPATCQETDPSRKPASSPCPRLPTTTISAPRLRSHST
jgi:hypothetical protein